MNFKELKKRLSLKLDLVMLYKKFPKNFFGELTFENWFKIYNQSSYGSKLEKLALTKMSKLAQTFEEWLKTYNVSPTGSELEKIALTKMSKMI